MTRVLILLALAFAIAYLAVRGVARLQSRLMEILTEPVANRQVPSSELIECPTCGVHLPRSRAFEAKDGSVSGPGAPAPRVFCSEDCWRQAISMPETIRSRSA